MQEGFLPNGHILLFYAPAANPWRAFAGYTSAGAAGLPIGMPTYTSFLKKQNSKSHFSPSDLYFTLESHTYDESTPR